MRIFKFGGASVKDADAVRNVNNIIDSFKNDKLIIVVSAMGKTTNAMEEITHALWNKEFDKFRELVSERKSFHLNIIDELFEEKNNPIFTEVKTIFNDLGNRVNVPIADNFDFEYDQIVSLGEVVSTKIIQAYIANNRKDSFWLDARKVIRTNHSYREGEVDWSRTQGLISEKISANSDKSVFITQGFLGHTAEGMTTTLGREGSDYTAGIFAYCLNAKDVTIWKDVPGMLNADPKWFDNTIKLDSISFKEAIELAYYGASVIHPKTIKPLQNKGIPLFVKSFIHPSDAGTIIQKSTENDSLVPSFIFKMNQALISITPKDFSFIAENNLSEIFDILSKENVKMNIMQNSALSFSFCVDVEKVDVPKLLNSLNEQFDVRFNEGLELVTIRHYDQETIERLIENKEILLEQKTRQTARILMKDLG